ncbi:MAG TPA: hypothetical protein VEU94_18815, partial [Terriglobales bacterium]|nr:hypothetical protein [Terriglobales bacterium]
MIRKLVIALIFCLLLVRYPLGAQSVSAPNSGVPVRTGVYDPSLDAKVEALLRQMTLEEKVGQLVQYSPGQA